MSWKKVSLFSKILGKTERQVDPASLPSIDDEIALELGGVSLKWDHGEWSAEGVESSSSGGVGPAFKKELQRLKAENDMLKEQLRMSEFRNNVLVELLAGSRLDLDELDKEHDAALAQLDNVTAA